MAPLLSIASYNCKHFGGCHVDLKKSFVKGLFNQCDIVMLQEHWLYESQFHVFSDSMLCDNIGMHGGSAMNPSVIRSGRPHGGCIILWQEKTGLSISAVETVSSRLNAVIVSVSNVKFLLFNVYMPCDSKGFNDDFSSYQDVLAEIVAITNGSDTDFTVIGGDFNTDFSRCSPVTEELTKFCEYECFKRCSVISDCNIPYTFECLATGSRSCIDHMLISDNMTDRVVRHYSYDGIDNASDHLAIITQFDMKCARSSLPPMSKKQRVAWYKASPKDIDAYKNKLDEELSNIVLPDECITCLDVFCDKHHDCIETFCNDIISACINASKTVPHTCTIDKSSKVRVPGWNDYCKDKRKVAIYWHNVWKDIGRPRDGHIAYMRRKTRSEYHKIVKNVRKKEDALRSEKMAKSLLDNNSRQFWTEVRAMRGGCSNKPPAQVDKTVGNAEIAELFANKFQGVFNSVGYDKNCVEGLYGRCNDMLSNHLNVELCHITTDDIKKYIKMIKFGKSDGNAGLFSDNFKYGTDKLIVYLKYLFNMMIVHGKSPHNMLVGTAIPIPKHRRSNKNSSDNFRGICLQSILCKMLDMFMLDKEGTSLQTSELQFGFKEGMSTDFATAVISETIDYYTNRSGDVYMLALDATKAFDRVDFTKLFGILFERNVNPVYIRLLLKMYLDQKIRVNFNGSTSEYFNVSNGVKQGGVLSPVLFSCYVNGLIDKLQNCQMGCYVSDLYVGCVAYADDIVLLSPTIEALKRQILIAEDFAKEHAMLFNGTKSKLMSFSKIHKSKDIIVKVGGEIVSHTDRMTYLGHCLFSNMFESPVKDISNDFVVKFNGVLGDFANVKSSLRHELVMKYCTSFYGVIFCDFAARTGLSLLCTQWRKALRKIWRLPNRAHCRLLPLITGGLPLDIVLKRRFLNFFNSGLSSENNIVRSIFHLAKNSFSRLGGNFRAICPNTGKGSNNVHSVDLVIKNLIIAWKDNLADKDVRIASQIRELVDIRDDLFSGFLSKGECQNLIDFLATV